MSDLLKSVLPTEELVEDAANAIGGSTEGHVAAGTDRPGILKEASDTVAEESCGDDGDESSPTSDASAPDTSFSDPLAPVQGLKQMHLRSYYSREDEQRGTAEIGRYVSEILARPESRTAFDEESGEWRRQAYTRKPNLADFQTFLTFVVRYARAAVDREDAQKASRDARALSTLFIERVPVENFFHEIRNRGLPKLAELAAERRLKAKTQSELPTSAASAQRERLNNPSASMAADAGLKSKIVGEVAPDQPSKCLLQIEVNLKKSEAKAFIPGARITVATQGARIPIWGMLRAVR